jgi:hypothetical protein
MSRQDEPLLREREDVPEELGRALRVAVNDDFPSPARLKRIEGHLVAEVIASSSQKASASDVERWRGIAAARLREKMAETSGGRTVIGSGSRTTFVKMAAALAAVAAVWAGVAGYRAHRHATPWATIPAPLSSVADLPRFGSSQPESATQKLQRVAPSPEPVASANPLDPSPSVAEMEAPPPAPALPPRKAIPLSLPLLSRDDPWGLTSAPKSAAPVDKRAPAPRAAIEEDLLERATRALATDPQTALALMEQHRATFANGKLAQEREVVIIQALAKLGRLDAAQSVAKRFLAEHPESPYAKDVLTMAGAPRR